MRYVLILLGIYLIINAVTYFIKLADLLSNSYEFTTYGLGIFAGKFIFLLTGITFIYFGIKQIRAKAALNTK